MNRLIITTSLVALLSACATSQTTAPVTDSAKASAKGTNSIASAQIRQSGLPPYMDPKNVLSQKRSVYFDVDEYTVRGQFLSTADAHAKYLSANRGQKIRIEGNADENGSREYNLALGQKRAHAVRKVMTMFGVQENQIEAVSFGEEKPKITGHNETSWAENRRADIRYTDEK